MRKYPDGLAPKIRNVNATQIFWYAISFELAYCSAAFVINWPAIPAILGGIYWHWLYETLKENFVVEFALQNGEHVINIHATGDTPGIDMYIANIVLDEDEGDYKAYVDNESNTELRVFVTNKGSGTLQMHVSGEVGSYTFIIVKEGKVDIYVDDAGLDLHVKILRKLALDIHSSGGRSLTKEQILEKFSRYLPEVNIEDERAEDVLDEIVQRNVLIKEVSIGVYEFLHLSFQEYFAALELWNIYMIPGGRK